MDSNNNYAVVGLKHYNKMRDELAVLRADSRRWVNSMREKDQQLLEKDRRIDQMAEQILFLQDQLSLECDCEVEEEEEEGYIIEKESA